MSEANGLGTFLEGASSARLSAVAAADFSRAWVSGAWSTVRECVDVQPSPRVGPPPARLSSSELAKPAYWQVRPEEQAAVWGLASTE